MKKKVIAVFCVILSLVLIFSLIFFTAAQRGLGLTVARFLVTESGSSISYMMVKENSPIVMHAVGERENLFKSVDTGDKIFVIHDGINETYPGSTGVYAVFKLSGGETSDIPDTVLETLKELGYCALVPEGKIRN